MNSELHDKGGVIGSATGSLGSAPVKNSAALNEYIDVILDDMDQAGKLPADRDQAAAELKRDLKAQIVQALIAALPEDTAAELQRRMHHPDATPASIHQSCSAAVSTSLKSPAAPCRTTRPSDRTSANRAPRQRRR